MRSLPIYALIPVFLFSPLHLACAEKNSVVQIYTAPEMNLEEIDRSVLDQLGQGARVNFADQALSDRIVIESLSNAADRGAHIRIYLDPREVERLALDNENPLVKLSRMRNVEIKLKASADGSMRLKGYSVNGSLLRIGSANESHSGLERQDNDLVVITEKDAVAAFDRKFDAMWARPNNKKFSFP
jgi:phosphatidylserine/phosphatidylglycerophosphate/cardiolipin synthase-like enzyme